MGEFQGSASLHRRGAEDAEIAEQGKANRKVGLPIKFAIGISAICLITCGIGGWMVLDANSPLNRASAVNATIDWACLADLPTTATDINIQTTGSSFSREFTITFKDSPTNISSWIAASPGPSSVTPSTDAHGWTIYDYPACQGAQHAEVRVSPAGDQAIINTYWS